MSGVKCQVSHVSLKKNICIQIGEASREGLLSTRPTLLSFARAPFMALLLFPTRIFENFMLICRFVEIFTESAHWAMSVCLSVCLCVCVSPEVSVCDVAKHPLPEIVETSGHKMYS